MTTLISEIQTIPLNKSTIKKLRNPLYKKNKNKENNNNNNNNNTESNEKLKLQKVDRENERLSTSQNDKKEVKTTVDRIISTLTHSNQLGSVLNHQLRSISRDVTAMQEMADQLEEDKQNEFTSIVQVYNTIIQDVCHFSINQRSVINKVMISIELNDKDMFLQNLEVIDVNTCKNVLHNITDFSTLLTNFVASLKITKSKIYKDWKFWLGATIGGISAVAAVLTLGLAFWVEVGIAAGLLTAGALIGSLSIWGVVSRRTNKKRMTHLNDLKETLKRADSHLIQVKGVVTKIGDHLDYFIEQMFHNPQFKEIILKTMEIFDELDGLLGHQVC